MQAPEDFRLAIATTPELLDRREGPYGEAVLRQSASHGAADAAGCPGYDGSLD